MSDVIALGEGWTLFRFAVIAVPGVVAGAALCVFGRRRHWPVFRQEWDEW